MAKEIRLKKEYFKTVKNFVPSELLKACRTSFGNKIADDIGKQFKSHRNKWTKEDCVNYIFEVMNYAYLQEKLAYIQLSDVFLHSKKRTWYSFELCGKTNHVLQSEGGLKRDFSATFEKMNLKYDIAVTMCDEVAWIRLALPSKADSALYLAYFIGEEFIFTSKRKINFKLMQALSSSLRYECLKTLDVLGKDVWSLLKILNQKKSKALDVEIDHVGHNSQENIQNSMVVDFSQKNARRAEMKGCFAINSPDLQSFTIKSESGFRVGEILPEMEGYPCRSRIRINHPNLGEFLNEALQNNVITQPLPQYIKHFCLTGKNVITLKDSTAKK